MIINGKQTRSIWLSEDKNSIEIIDQRFLPFEFVVEKISTVKQMFTAIKDMHLRGAPLIGVAAGFGMYLATLEAKNAADFDRHIIECAELLESSRPTAVNLKWALNRLLKEITIAKSVDDKINIVLKTAIIMADEDAEVCRMIGVHGLKLIETISKKKNGKPVNILTHCNAGGLACVDYGTATSPMYHAKDSNIPIHVWVDETRPRNQGKLTSYELTEYNIPNTVICDNAGGYLMQHGMVDIVFVGTDRTTANGDAANKIGTYLKALAAADNNIPFYVALPSSTIDWSINNGSLIPIEERSEDEVLEIEGLSDGKITSVKLFSAKTKALNYGFDVTPARLITGFITERGICKPSELKKFFGVYTV
jgi:methylthioribose-1-phosphate isomerase